jgi:hypothetical protein
MRSFATNFSGEKRRGEVVKDNWAGRHVNVDVIRRRSRTAGTIVRVTHLDLSSTEGVVVKNAAHATPTFY